MKKIFITMTAVLFVVLSLAGIESAVAAKASLGEQSFVKNCAVCHANGENIINPLKTLHRKILEMNGIKKPADIVEKMRHPGPGMTTFDKETIPDKEAKAIAEYILKTFK
ncbi:MAG TPA: c-type cytochrome [Syntrophales bacterium]|nr:c-type cytochrome [Syntrophales bacterium]